MESPPDCMTIIAGITSKIESTRKLAVFNLQGLVADASFADAFVQAGGLPALKAAVLNEQGNVLAYALGSFTGLLELDFGWETVGSDVIERAIELVINQSLINVLRNALFLLVLVVARPIDQLMATPNRVPSSVQTFGVDAVLPLLQMHEDFHVCLIDKLDSADHALCANALNFINALMRDSIVHGAEDELPDLITRLQDLGLIRAVEALMRGGALPDLVKSLLEFQGLTKVLLARWRGVAVDLHKPEHEAVLMQLRSSSLKLGFSRASPSEKTSAVDMAAHEWRRLGFQSENPDRDFGITGFLGLMDLSEYVRRNADGFRNILLEQSIIDPEQRCPLARASLSVTMLLYEYFDIESITKEDYSARLLSNMEGDDLERYIEPLVLYWASMHRATLTAFLKLWKEAGAVMEDYHKIEDLTRLLIGHVFGDHSRKGTTEDVEQHLAGMSLQEVRTLQLAELDAAYDYAWGADIGKVREIVHGESIQFLKEQRIRCLLQGSWFPVMSGGSSQSNMIMSRAEPTRPSVIAWRFVQLSPDRRHLHYSAYPSQLEQDPQLKDLSYTIDLGKISSVDSSVSRYPFPIDHEMRGSKKGTGSVVEKKNLAQTMTVTSLTIRGSAPSTLDLSHKEKALLELTSSSTSLASEWLDGLLMLMNQQPITADTDKYVQVVEDWTLKCRMVNLRWEDVDWERAQTGEKKELPPMPTDRDYWYDMEV